jgi:hypothetical protein
MELERRLKRKNKKMLKMQKIFLNIKEFFSNL